MLKMKVSYIDEVEKDKLVEELKENFQVSRISKICDKKGPYRRVYITLSSKY